MDHDLRYNPEKKQKNKSLVTKWKLCWSFAILRPQKLPLLCGLFLRARKRCELGLFPQSQPLAFWAVHITAAGIIIC